MSSVRGALAEEEVEVDEVERCERGDDALLLVGDEVKGMAIESERSAWVCGSWFRATARRATATATWLARGGLAWIRATGAQTPGPRLTPHCARCAACA